MHVFERRVTRTDVAHRKEGMKSLCRQALGLRGIGKDALDLAREANDAGVFGVIERLDADPVPRQQKPPLVAVPERNGEHTLQTIEYTIAPREIAERNDLGVATRAEFESEVTRQFRAELPVVINFPIIADDDPT